MLFTSPAQQVAKQCIQRGIVYIKCVHTYKYPIYFVQIYMKVSSQR